MSDQNQIPLFDNPSPKNEGVESLNNSPEHSPDSLSGGDGGGVPHAYATVILPLALPTTYTYSVPEIFANKIKQGCRVEVVLGKNKRYAGIVKSISVEPPPYQTKDILNILDDEPLLYPEQLKLWKWMSDYYMCSEGEVMAAALPAHFKLSSETILLFNEDYGDDFTGLDNDEYVVAEALLIKKQLNLTEALRAAS